MNEICGCCEGIEPVTPARIANRPGLNALAYRVGTHARFFETMLAQLARKSLHIPKRDPQGQPITETIYPLRSLSTRSPDDPSIALLDAWATVADVLSFYQERIANEGYLQTATERRSVLEIGRLVGYRPLPGVAATTYLAYTLDQGAETTIKAGSKVQSVPGPGEFPQTFETAEDLEARGAWNTLQVRQTRPIGSAALAQQTNGASATLYFKGTTTGLRPNDPLLADFGVQQIVYRVIDVTPDAAADRTQVTVRPWQTTSTQPMIIPPTRASTRPHTALAVVDEIVQALFSLVARYTNLAAFNVPRTSVIAGRVVELLERLRTNLMLGLRGNDLREFLSNDALPGLRVERETASRTRSTPLQNWLSSLVLELEAISTRIEALSESDSDVEHDLHESIAGVTVGANQGSHSSNGLMTHGRAVALPRRAEQLQATTTIGNSLATLTKPPSAQPANGLRLERSVAATFGSRSDTLPSLLTTMRPELAPVLYQAWRNVPATPPPTLRVYALRTRASAFGHNAPPEPVKNSQGVIIGTREWTLYKASGDQVPEQFTVDMSLLPESESTPQTSVEITVSIANATVSARPTLEELLAGAYTVDFPAAAEQLVVTLTLPGVSPVTPGLLRIVFTQRAMTFETTLNTTTDARSLRWSSEGSDPTNVRYSINPQLGDLATNTRARPQVTISGQKRTAAGTVPTEQPDVISLDTTYPALVPESWIVLERPELLSSLPAQSLIVSRVVGVREASRADYGLTGKSTFVQLDQQWLRLGPGGDTFAVIRGTAVYAQSEPLELVEAPRDPVEESVCDNEILLDQLYDGLKPGRWLIISGERTDVYGQASDSEADGSANSVRISGVPATELVMLGGVRQEFDTQEEGARTRTTLVLARALAYCYKRDTVKIYGNVVKATHGETRNEALGSGDGSKPNQVFDLKQKPLTYVSAMTPSGVESTLMTYVDGVRWHETDSLVGLTPTERRFITKTADDDTTSVIFGNGRAGARLPTGQENVTAIYRFGIGKVGNVKAEQLTLLSTRPQGVMAVVNPLPPTGGADREDESQMRRNIPLAVTSLDRIIAVQDYADFARTFAGIGKANAVRLTNGRREIVHVTIAGADDIPIDENSDVYKNLRQALRQYGDPFQPFQIAVRRLRLLVIAANVQIGPDYLWENVAPAIRATLLARFSFARRDLGQDVARSEVLSAIQGVKGVVYVDLDILDTVDEEKVTQELTTPTDGGLAANLTLRSYITANLAQRVIEPTPHIQPAELIVLSPDQPDTLILSEIAA